MEFVSLRSIIYDILNIIRGAKVGDDEPISERQVESWVHQYRALLLKRDLDKHKDPNPAYIQNINNINLVLDSDKNTYRTSIEIPKPVDLNYGSGITFIGDSYGNQIQLVPESRAPWQKYKKFTMGDTLAYINNNYIYIYNAKALSTIYIRGVFEIPTKVIEANGNIPTYDYPYPIPITLLPDLKSLILKTELGIEYTSMSDNVNDANNVQRQE